MADNWTKLKWRLQSVANNRDDGGCEGVALISIKIFLSGGLPIGWCKPNRVSLEPRNFDVSLLSISEIGNGWDDLMHSIVPESMRNSTGTLERIFVVKEGIPVGWITRGEQAVIFA